jgi:hypothetical protein
VTSDTVKFVVELADLAHVMAGGTLVIASAGVELIPSQRLYEASNRIRTRQNGGRRVITRPPENGGDK